MRVSEIKLLGHKIKIIRTMDENHLVKDGEKCDGLWDGTNLCIYIDAKLAESKQLMILLHELNHAISDILSLGLDEGSTHLLAVSYHQIIMDNPLFLIGLSKCFRKSNSME